MAAASPAMSNNSSDAGASATATASFQRTDAPPKTLRGLNKPKCIQCGNVARSRCPYQSCKSCCFKAQNPCHIHVLKANATLADNAATAAAPAPSQPPPEVSPAVNSLRVASLRQLSNSFSQFNNLQGPLRSKKPLTKKEAVAINEWRFSKLKEYRDRNIDSENEAFDRYMKKVSLLEEVFSVNSILEDHSDDGSLGSCIGHTSAVDDEEKMISEQKLRLRSNPIRGENVRKRIQHIVDEGLKKLRKRECSSSSDGGERNGYDEGPEKVKDEWVERTSVLNDLIDKLNKARNEEDLKSCSDLKAKLYMKCVESGNAETKDVASEEQTTTDMESIKELDYFLGKVFREVEIDQDCLKTIDAHFATLGKIEDL